MCVSCGCGLIHDDHGDHRHITIEGLHAAADAANETIQTAAHNIESVVMHQFPVAKDATNVPEFTEFLSSLVAPAPLGGAVVKSSDEDRFLLMVAYSPNRMPLRGADKRTDLASPRVLEKACWSFMAKGAKTGMWHEDGHGDEAVCVENYVYRPPTPWDVNGDGSLVVKQGDWIVGFILSDAAWSLYKSGRIGGVSMQGGAGRKKASPEAIARAGSDA